ncbi:MAG: RtcB family protein [bacterium]
MNASINLRKINDYCWEIPRRDEMHVPGRIYTSEKLLPQILKDQAAGQVKNVAMLPGIVGNSLAMPDIHWGYGFPIGGVAGFKQEEGVISPGGIGYDISCGVRLMRTDLLFSEVRERVDELLRVLFAAVPSGVGSTSRLKLSNTEMKAVLHKGAQWAVGRGYGDAEDLASIEDSGYMKEADNEHVSARAMMRGSNQLGTLGSGNHFLEIQEITEVYNQYAADVMGLFKGQLVVMVHTGSRGLGYQVCDDYIKVMQNAGKKYNITLPDKQLACAPITSEEGQRYLSAMAAATNFARANRQIIGSWIQETLLRVLNISPQQLGFKLVYDVSHNIGKMEEHIVGGRKQKLCVHRKGATRSLPAGHPLVPDHYKSIGQPVIIPGSMGTASYVLLGTEKAVTDSFGSTSHGAGRVMSRSQAKRMVRGREVKEQLNRKSILVYTDSYGGLAEEMPAAYKDVHEVVEVCEQAGLSTKVAQMVPWGVIKG